MEHGGDDKVDRIFDVRANLFDGIDAELSAYRIAQDNAPSFLTASKKAYSKIKFSADEIFPIAHTVRKFEIVFACFSAHFFDKLSFTGYQGLMDSWGSSKEMIKELFYSKIEQLRTAEVEENKSASVRKVLFVSLIQQLEEY
jgi:hypothetical protein